MCLGPAATGRPVEGERMDSWWRFLGGLGKDGVRVRVRVRARVGVGVRAGAGLG